MTPQYGPARLPSAWRALVHAVVIVAGWALFVWSWFDVAGRPWRTHELWLLIIVSLIALPVLSIAWILHNLALYRRKGPRRSVPVVTQSYERDWLGRRIDADFGALAQLAWIDIDADAGTPATGGSGERAGVKRYRPGRPPQRAQDPAAAGPSPSPSPSPSAPAPAPAPGTGTGTGTGTTDTAS